MEHAESSRGRTQAEMVASFTQQYAEEKGQDPKMISMHQIEDLEWRSFLTPDTGSVLRQLEQLIQTWQTTDNFALDKPQQEYASDLPHPLLNSKCSKL